MPDEKQPSETFKLVQPSGGVHHVYANASHLSWTGMDITVELYHLAQPNRDLPSLAGAPNELLHDTSVTLTWSAAKSFYETLGGALERYEKVYGPIKTKFQQI